MATTSIGSTGVTFPDGTTQASSATPSVVVRTYSAPATWTKPAFVKAVRVTVFGAGGNGGSTTTGTGGAAAGGGGSGGGAKGTYPAPSIPGPISVTVGGAGSASPSSFGSLISATAGATAPTMGHTGQPTIGSGPGGAAGVGSNGQLNFYGNAGLSAPGNGGGAGGVAIQNLNSGPAPGGVYPGSPGTFPGPAQPQISGGGGGAVSANPGGNATGGAGGPGYIVVEEFY